MVSKDNSRAENLFKFESVDRFRDDFKGLCASGPRCCTRRRGCEALTVARLAGDTMNILRRKDLEDYHLRRTLPTANGFHSKLLTLQVCQKGGEIKTQLTGFIHVCVYSLSTVKA